MNEKEIAKKIWTIFDDYRKAVDCRCDDDEFKRLAPVAISQIERAVERILPRPKKKVKKTMKMWICANWNVIEKVVYPTGLYTVRDEALEAKKKYGGSMTEIEVFVEVEE